MATQKLNLTRDQLATFLKNYEQIKQFENLFAIANQVAPSPDTPGIEVLAGNSQATANDALAQIVSLAKDLAVNTGNADQKAVQALDALGRIANALEMLATAPVIQNNNSVVTDYIDLPEDGPHVTQARRVQWNQDDGTVDIGLYGGSVLQVGQELMYYAKNTSGGLIANGTPVMFTGTVGASGKLEFGLAVADGSVLADYMMGVTTQDIADNDFGYVTSFGLVRGFDTTGSPYGEVWNDGDLLYFDPATPGTWTNVAPQAPNIDVPVAVVVNAGPGGSGSIFVRMTVAESLARLQDVYINGTGTPANGDVLVYDLADSRWENRTQSTIVAGRADNISGGLAGSIPYQTAVNVTAMLGSVATGNALISGGVGVAPSWGKIGLTTHVSGTLPVANGGTGLTALGAGVQTWLGTPSSANLAAAVTDETGSGSLVFGTRPSFSATIGVGSATASASGAGVSFPASQSASTDANTLDDYEEGTWTPTITSQIGTFTSVAASGTYTKIGRLVSIQVYIVISNAGTASGALFFTLPFNQAGSNFSVGAGRENAVTGNMLQIFSSATGGIVWTYANASPIATNHQLYCSLTYITST